MLDVHVEWNATAAAAVGVTVVHGERLVSEPGLIDDKGYCCSCNNARDELRARVLLLLLVVLV